MSEDSVGVEQRAASLLSALGKLPRYQGISFRGKPQSARLYRAGEVVVSRGLVATSQDIRVATENVNVSGLFAVLGQTGRALEQVSRHPDEKEIVFLPSSMFLVLESWEAHGVQVTLVEELDPQSDGDASGRSLDDVRKLVVKHVVMAQRRSDVTVHSPGKFLGDVD